MPDNLKYYVVHTNAGAEMTAERSLRQAGYDTFYPHYPGTATLGRKTIGVIRPYFPRYLFIGVEEGQGLYAANKAIGVSIVLHSADGPFEVAKSVVDEIKARCGQSGLINAPVIKQGHGRELSRLHRGTSVVITGGPLKGMPGTVEEDDGKSREIKVSVTLFGKAMPASVLSTELAVKMDRCA